jgi:hypothetical protein
MYNIVSKNQKYTLLYFVKNENNFMKIRNVLKNKNRKGV